MYRDIDIIKSGGVELRGMKASLAPRRQQTQAPPKLEQYTFVPLTGDKVKMESFWEASRMHISFPYHHGSCYFEQSSQKTLLDLI